MKKLMAFAAAATLAAGLTAAQAQTPGAGSPGQDQRPDFKDQPGHAAGTPPVADAPSASKTNKSQGTTGAAPMSKETYPTPRVKNDSSIHQSAGDRDSRGTPK